MTRAIEAAASFDADGAMKENATDSEDRAKEAPETRKNSPVVPFRPRIVLDDSPAPSSSEQFILLGLLLISDEARRAVWAASAGFKRCVCRVPAADGATREVRSKPAIACASSQAV